ncbi:slr1658 superfamily regulator [Caenispirillum bisanense]|uniref:slr1658 superfamily regulator n=1 Tax=Caenispirillum bisanense TaxID=414052 RepID=UPI0031E2E52F
MNDTIGTFVAPQEDMGGETLMLRFSPSSVPLQQRWRNNGLSADFLADYVTTFLPGDEGTDGGDALAEARRDQISSAVNFIANELLENAMKYSAGGLPYPISIRLQLEDGRVAFWETNTVTPAQAATFRDFIHRLTTTDPGEFYVEQLEKAAEGTSTGLGFLTMINDYAANLGWKFEDAAGSAVTVTTFVTVDI